MSKLSRRSLVTSAAVLPALALPAGADSLAHEPDPIFAAIEKHRVTFAAFVARSEYEDGLAELGQKLISAPGDHRTPEMISAVEVSREARSELAKTAPTTIAGMAAYLDYVLSESETFEDMLFSENDEGKDFVRSLAGAAKRLAGGAVQS